MALPFYILQAKTIRGDASDVGIMLGAQTAGALLSNALWGWWGNPFGKRSLLAQKPAAQVFGQMKVVSCSDDPLERHFAVL